MQNRILIVVFEYSSLDFDLLSRVILRFKTMYSRIFILAVECVRITYPQTTDKSLSEDCF